MPKGSKIAPAVRRTWLDKFDAGSRLDELADAARRSPRTVKVHIDLARQEREQEAARVSFYRDTYARHQADLGEALGVLRDEVLGSREATTAAQRHRQRLLQDALKSHLRRGGVWEKYTKWKAATEAQARAADALKQWLQSELQKVTSDSKLAEQWLGSLYQVVPKALEAAHEVSLGYERVPSEGGWDLYRGGSLFAGDVATPALAETLEAVDCRLLEQAQKSVYGMQIRGALARRAKAEDEVVEQAELQLLRQVLPGRCILCP